MGLFDRFRKKANNTATASTPSEDIKPVDPAQENESKIRAAMQAADAAYKERDYATAKAQYTIASDAGLALAKFHLAGLYAAGEGVERDVKLALSWYDQAHYALAKDPLVHDADCGITPKTIYEAAFSLAMKTAENGRELNEAVSWHKRLYADASDAAAQAHKEAHLKSIADKRAAFLNAYCQKADMAERAGDLALAAGEYDRAFQHYDRARQMGRCTYCGLAEACLGMGELSQAVIWAARGVGFGEYGAQRMLDKCEARQNGTEYVEPEDCAEPYDPQDEPLYTQMLCNWRKTLRKEIDADLMMKIAKILIGYYFKDKENNKFALAAEAGHWCRRAAIHGNVQAQELRKTHEHLWAKAVLAAAEELPPHEQQRALYPIASHCLAPGIAFHTAQILYQRERYFESLIFCRLDAEMGHEPAIELEWQMDTLCQGLGKEKLEKGHNSLKRKEYHRAIAEYREAAEYGLKVRYDIAKVYKAKGDLDSWHAWVKKAIDSGEITVEQQQEYEKACKEEALRQFRKKEAESAALRRALAETRRKEAEEALAQVAAKRAEDKRKAAEIAAIDGEKCMHWAQKWLDDGKYYLARKDAEKAQLAGMPGADELLRKIDAAEHKEEYERLETAAQWMYDSLDYETALDFYKQLAAAGLPQGYYGAALCCRELDYRESALLWAQKALDAGVSDAQKLLDELR